VTLGSEQFTGRSWRHVRREAGRARR